jgi:hypothetical protein
MKDLAVNATNIEEYVRETLGEDTCDARRSVSDPNTPRAGANRPPRPGPAGPCSFDKGLSSTYPHYKYRVRLSACAEGERGLCECVRHCRHLSNGCPWLQHTDGTFLSSHRSGNAHRWMLFGGSRREW